MLKLSESALLALCDAADHSEGRWTAQPAFRVLFELYEQGLIWFDRHGSPRINARGRTVARG